MLFTAILSFASIINIFNSHEKRSQETVSCEKNETELNSNNFLKSPLYHQNKLRDINNFFRNSNYTNYNTVDNSNFINSDSYYSKLVTLSNYVYFNWIKTISLKELIILICRYNI